MKIEYSTRKHRAVEIKSRCAFYCDLALIFISRLVS